MPILLMLCGCIFLFFSILFISIPILSVFDLASIEWLSQHRSVFLNKVTTCLSLIGGTPFVLFISVLCTIYMIWYEKYSNLAFYYIALFGSIGLGWSLKYLIAKPRPPQNFHLVESYGASFPSAHSLYAATLACLVIYIYLQHPKHKVILLCSMIWMLLMGFSRVYVGVHFPSDILSGWGIGLIWTSLLYLIFFKYRSARNL